MDLKTVAHRIKDELVRRGQHATKGQVYELLATAAGFNSYNAYVAAPEKGEFNLNRFASHVLQRVTKLNENRQEKAAEEGDEIPALNLDGAMVLEVMKEKLEELT